MKTASAELIDLINQTRAGTAQFFDFDLYSIVPAGNPSLLLEDGSGHVLTESGFRILLESASPLYFTNADFDIFANGITYSSKTVRFDEKTSKTTAHWKEGFDVDTWSLVTMPRALDPVTGVAFPDAIGGVPWLQACRGGVFANADFQVDRAFFSSMPTWPMPPGGAVPVDVLIGVFAGLVGAVDVNDLTAILNIQDYRSLFTIQMPRNIYQGQCRHVLFDAGCQLIAASFQVSGAAIGGSTRASIANTLGAPAGSGTYVLGTITMTSGFNKGFSRIITSWAGAASPFALMIPLPFPVVSGDTFVATPGCAKTQNACNLFANIVNYGGQPYVPTAETAY